MDTDDLHGLAHLLDLIAKMLAFGAHCGFLLRGKVSLVRLNGWAGAVPSAVRNVCAVNAYILVRLTLACNTIATMLHFAEGFLLCFTLLALAFDLAFWFGVMVLCFPAWSARWRR